MDVSMYETALARTGAVVAGTRRDQFGDPTPCSDWDVRRLLNHIIGGCITFASGASGKPVPMDDGTDHAEGDHIAAYEHAAHSALEAFRTAGTLERDLALPWGDTRGDVAFGLALTEAVVHGWDLATATGQGIEIDDDVAEALHERTSSMMAPLGPYPRGDTFGPPVEVAGNASPSARLLAYLGRRP